MHPAALWPIVLDHQRSLLAEADGERLASLARQSGRARQARQTHRTAGVPGPVRFAAVLLGRGLSASGQAAIAASCRLEAIGAGVSPR